MYFNIDVDCILFVWNVGLIKIVIGNLVWRKLVSWRFGFKFFFIIYLDELVFFIIYLDEFDICLGSFLINFFRDFLDRMGLGWWEISWFFCLVEWKLFDFIIFFCFVIGLWYSIYL